MDQSFFPELANIMRNNIEMQRCMLEQNRLLTQLYIKNNEMVTNVLRRLECMNKTPPSSTEQNSFSVDRTLHNLLTNNINSPDGMSFRDYDGGDNGNDNGNDDGNDNGNDDGDDNGDDNDTVDSVPSALTNEDRAATAEARCSSYQDKTEDHQQFERRLEPLKLLMLQQKIKNRKKRYRIKKYFEQHCECFVCHGLMWEPATKQTLRMHLKQRPRSWPTKNFELRRSTAEHKQPKHCGGTEKYDNLVVTCLRCNQKRADHFSLTFPDSSVASSSYNL